MDARVLLILLSCGSPSESIEPEPVVEAAPAVAPAPAPAPVTWTAAWPVEGGGARVDAGAGLALTPRGLVAVEGTPCGPEAVRIDDAALLGLPGGEAVEFPRAPANPAATVERVGWRLAGILGPREGLVPGGAAPSEPARHEGIWIRSVRKTRRPGAPPILVAVGDRDDTVLVALMDKQADAVLGSHALTSAHGPFTRVGSTPAWDLDGDGSVEIAVWADSPHGSVRAVYRVDLGPAPSLDPLWSAQEPIARCP